ncbi:fibronectin type III domain-containing protein [Streptomyces sp. NPDC056149]|uniref:fibronectin type III domain-containing protein n=1 Tax=Streptomyces sp. NPDC056149 TaxID=3345728 RepID=UPI0035D8A674
MPRKRMVLVCASALVGVGALAVIPVVATAGQSAELGASCRIAGGASPWWATGNMVIRNSGNAYAKDWKLEFDLSEGQATIHDPWAFTLRQAGRHVTVTPIGDRAGVPAKGERKVDVGINPSGKGIPRTSGCKVDGRDDPGVPEDTTPPSDPVEKGSHVIDHRTVHVMWRASEDSGSGVDKYEVFQDGKLAKTVGNGMTMTNVENLKPATTHRFKVRAVDVAGNRSGFSREVSLTTHPAPGDDTQKPTMPKKLAGEAIGPNQVSLRWLAATDDVAVTGYRIYRNGAKAQEAGSTATSAVLGGLSPNTVYRFKVTALDGSGKESDPTDEITVTTTADGGGGDGGNGAPGDFAASTLAKQDGPVTQHYLNLAWAVPKGQGQITTYQVHLDGKLAQTFMWGTGDPIMPIPSGRASREVLVGANPGRTYKVKLRAQLGNGSWGAFSPEKSVTTGR